MNKYIFLTLTIVTSISTSSLAQAKEVIDAEGVENNCFEPFEDKARLALLDLFSNAAKNCTKGYPEKSPEVVLTQVGPCIVVAKSKFTCTEY